MGKLLQSLRAGSASYDIDESGLGVVLIRRIEHGDEFSQLVRELMNTSTDEFVVFPVSDGHRGYEQAILLPL